MLNWITKVNIQLGLQSIEPTVQPIERCSQITIFAIFTLLHFSTLKLTLAQPLESADQLVISRTVALEALCLHVTGLV